jgi:MFS family permease
MVGVLLLVLAWPAVLVLIGSAGVVYAGVLFVALGAYETRPVQRQSGEDEESVDVWGGDRRLFVYPIIAIFLFFSIRMIAAGGVNVFIPEFITSVYGFSLTAFGFTVTPASVASFFYAVLLLTAGTTQLATGALVDRFDHRKVLLAFLGTATVLLVLLATVVLSPVALFLALAALGGSMWGLNPARDSLISEITPAEREGRTFGYLWTGGMVVGSASPVIVGYIGEVAGLQRAFALLAVMTVLSAVPIALLLSPRVYRRRVGSEPAPGAD